MIALALVAAVRGEVEAGGFVRRYFTVPAELCRLFATS